MGDTDITNTPKSAVRNARAKQCVEDLFTPDARSCLSLLRRDVRNMAYSTPPITVDAYLNWRVQLLTKRIEVEKCMRASLKEAYEKEKLTLRQYVKFRSQSWGAQNGLEEEEVTIYGQGRFFEELFHDSIKPVVTGYINDLYQSWRWESGEGQISPARCETPYEFNYRVANYLDAERGPEGNEERFCSVLGCWMDGFYTECARIVPKSFRTNNLAYIFGAQKAALSSARNGLIMFGRIKVGFDIGWITIVPYGSVESTPTEWKTVLLNDSVKDEIVCEQGTKVLYWKDLHERKLVFQNDQRPAGRYLFFRYLIALLHAEKKGWKGYRERVPPGQIWASPDKPGRYLRRSVLRTLARRICDEDILSAELDAGCFDDTDPPTGTEANDTIAGLELAIKVRKILKHREEDRLDWFFGAWTTLPYHGIRPCYANIHNELLP